MSHRPSKPPAGPTGADARFVSASVPSSGDEYSEPQYTVRPRNSSCKAIRRWFLRLYMFDLSLMYRVVLLRRLLPKSCRRFSDRLISSHPGYDLSCALWISMVVLIPFVGWPLTWMMVANVVLSFVLSWSLPSAVPLQLDPSLKVRGRVSPAGFPCVELHLSTVIAAVLWVEYKGDPGISAAGVLWVLLLLYTRLYALTHFLHQLAASIGLGLCSVPALYALSKMVFPKSVSSMNQLVAGVLVGFAFLGYIAYKIEQNDFPFFRIPRREYMRVISMVKMAQEGNMHTLFQRDEDNAPTFDQYGKRRPPAGPNRVVDATYRPESSSTIDLARTRVPPPGVPIGY